MNEFETPSAVSPLDILIENHYAYVDMVTPDEEESVEDVEWVEEDVTFEEDFTLEDFFFNA